MLGITARSTYVGSNQSSDMPSSIEVGSLGGAAAEPIQTTLVDFEPTIAGKTHSEILEMSRSQRSRWYKKISSEEKNEAQGVVDERRFQRISEALRGRSLSHGHRMKISRMLKGNQYAKGYRHTEETKKHLSKSLKGRKRPPRSEEWSRKISESLTGRPSPLRGKKHTEEAKRRMSEAHKGKVLSEEHRKHLSESLRGNQRARGMKHSEEIKKQISENTRIALQNPVVKEKMRRKSKEYWKDPENHKIHSERMTKVLESPEIRKKISDKAKGRTHSEETKKKISEGNKGKIISAETRNKLSLRMKGKPQGPLSEEHKRRISEARIGISPTNETRQKIAETLRGRYVGEDNPNWRNGSSFEPYCPKFNDELKEKIRNRDNRTCVLCGKGEIQNGRRLSVHHINSDKMQGCNGVPWYLCALCVSCNSKPDTAEKEFLIVTGGHGG